MLRIVVEGTTAAGKSAVAQVIQEALAAYGVPAPINDRDHLPREQERLEKIMRQVGMSDVEIEMRQLNREPARG